MTTVPNPYMQAAQIAAANRYDPFAQQITSMPNQFDNPWANIAQRFVQGVAGQGIRSLGREDQTRRAELFSQALNSPDTWSVLAKEPDFAQVAFPMAIQERAQLRQAKIEEARQNRANMQSAMAQLVSSGKVPQAQWPAAMQQIQQIYSPGGMNFDSRPGTAPSTIQPRQAPQLASAATPPTAGAMPSQVSAPAQVSPSAVQPASAGVPMTAGGGAQAGVNPIAFENQVRQAEYYGGADAGKSVRKIGESAAIDANKTREDIRKEVLENSNASDMRNVAIALRRAAETGNSAGTKLQGPVNLLREGYVAVNALEESMPFLKDLTGGELVTRDEAAEAEMNLSKTRGAGAELGKLARNALRGTGALSEGEYAISQAQFNAPIQGRESMLLTAQMYEQNAKKQQGYQNFVLNPQVDPAAAKQAWNIATNLDEAQSWVEGPNGQYVFNPAAAELTSAAAAAILQGAPIDAVRKRLASSVAQQQSEQAAQQMAQPAPQPETLSPLRENFAESVAPQVVSSLQTLAARAGLSDQVTPQTIANLQRAGKLEQFQRLLLERASTQSATPAAAVPTVQQMRGTQWTP